MSSKTADCVFIGYAQNSGAYKFLILRSGVLNQNTIIETNDANFWKYFPLKVEHIPRNIETSYASSSILENDDLNENLRRSKSYRKEKSFRDDFHTFLVEDEPRNFYEIVSSADKCEEAFKVDIGSLNKNKT